MILIISYVTSNSNKEIKTFVEDYDIIKIYDNVKYIDAEAYNKIII